MMSLLKIIPCLLALSTIVLGESTESTTRVSTTVKFEYKLDASNIPQFGSMQTIVDVIDSVMIDNLNKKLSPLEAAQLGDAELDHVKSEIYSQCFAKGDECVLARSLLTLSHTGSKSERFIHLAALRLVEQFIKDFDTRYVDVTTSYMFPKLMQNVVEFDIHGVDIHLKPDSINIFRETMMKVFGDALMTIQKDMNILDVQYIYQEKKGTGLETHLMISGICRSCTERSFKYMLEVVFDSSKDEFLAQLRSNAALIGSSDFAGVTSAEYDWPKEPEFLGDESIFVEDIAEEKDKDIPWWAIWIGIGLLLVSLGLGILLFSKDDMSVWEVDKTKKSCTSSDTSDDNSQSSLSSRHEFGEITPDGPNSHEKDNGEPPAYMDTISTKFSI